MIGPHLQMGTQRHTKLRSHVLEEEEPEFEPRESVPEP